jgi:phosphoglycerate dehydrogenase-like enzyme
MTKEKRDMGKRILVLPRRGLFAKLFSAETLKVLHGLGEVEINPGEGEWTGQELAERIGGVEVLVTGWGSAKLTDEVLGRADKLKLVAHTAGSVKFMLDEGLFARGIKVTAVAAAMVVPVAEMTVMLCLLALRPMHRWDAAMRAGESWAKLKVAGVGDELSSQVVGVVGAGQVGRHVVKLLRAWDVPVAVYDPYLTPEKAAAMGAEYCGSVDELVERSRIVTLHAPVLPETRHLIGRGQLAKLRDGGAVINTARAWLVDLEALEAELRAGRIWYYTDVYDTEPLPEGDKWRTMPNAFITPHLASHTPQAYHRQGAYAVEDVRRFLHGEPLRYEVVVGMLKTMA